MASAKPTRSYRGGTGNFIGPGGQVRSVRYENLLGAGGRDARLLVSSDAPLVAES
jgi:hypothetical protein